MYKKVLKNFIRVSFVISIAFSGVRADTLYAGLRCSEYGFKPVPTKAWITNAAKSMASLFKGAKPCVVWIADGFDQATNNEYLTYFDNNGVKVLIQVEPMEANVVTLLNSYLTKYKSHPSVIACGIDVEWYYPEENDGLGRKVTNAEGASWRTQVQNHNPKYKLLLKHFFPGWCPPTERTGIIFLDDSQQFPSLAKFLHETDPTTKWNVGYEVWAKAFTPAVSGMQYGYDDADGGPSDKLWWSKLGTGKFPDPQKIIGDSCLAVGPNTGFLFWVDFTAQEFTWTIQTDIKSDNVVFTPSMKIHMYNNKIAIEHPSLNNVASAKATLFDMKGKVVQKQVFENVTGRAEMKIRNTLSRGTYLLRVVSENQVLNGKVTLD